MEFKRAVAAAAVTRLVAGRRSLDDAVRHVLARIGDVVYVTLDGERKFKALVDFRERIMALDTDKAMPPRLGIARFHYDNCLKWVDGEKLRPDEAAELLMDALLDERR